MVICIVYINILIYLMSHGNLSIVSIPVFHVMRWWQLLGYYFIKLALFLECIYYFAHIVLKEAFLCISKSSSRFYAYLIYTECIFSAELSSTLKYNGSEVFVLKFMKTVQYPVRWTWILLATGSREPVQTLRIPSLNHGNYLTKVFLSI